MMKNLQTFLAVFVLTLFGYSASGQIVMLVQQPSNLAGSYNFTYADTWGADMTTVAVTAQAAFAVDGSATADSLACEAIVNRSEIEGKIAVLYRGACNFSLKAMNVQDSGAVAVVIINNIPGAPVAMGGGTNSAGVTIPVVMISDMDGALLRDAIIAGEVEIFLGNNTGLYASNVGSYKSHIALANSYSIPAQFAETETDFDVPVGAWVHNYGSTEAVNVVVTGVIDRDGTELYNEVSTGANIPVGDSLYFTLPLFTSGGYEVGVYTITYTIVSDDTDQFPDDNIATTSFWVNNEGKYSKSRVDAETGPLGGNGLRPANSTEFEWCIALQSENAESMLATGITFATLTNDIDLTGQAVQVSIYEWNDPISGGTVTFDDLNEATDNEIYDYTADLQGEFVTHTFAQPIELLNDQKYLACATILIDDMFLTVDGGIDYNVAYETYADEVFFPLNDIGSATWYAGGFGTDNVPAIIVNLQSATGIAEDVAALKITPYPNPTTDIINIPLGSTINGNVVLNVFDVEGRLVIDEEICQKSNKLTVDVTGLSSGLHTFSLMFEDNSRTSFQVVVTR
ncbi:MAG: T9SS type A sorting domain-containing protein [Flavobacteriales bacterium]|nr:T9SS type A sorting domain-containing protein [Flavobacteriales bacterium]